MIRRLTYSTPIRWGLCALLGTGSAVALGAPESGAEVRVQPPENYCLGGIEDRKVIVDESLVTDPFRQTTLLGCEVDGGDPQIMPDLPAPSAVHEVLA